MNIKNLVGWETSYMETKFPHHSSERVWHLLGFYLVLYQNYKHLDYLSSPTPRYIWRFAKANASWMLTFEYGIVPM